MTWSPARIKSDLSLSLLLLKKLDQEKGIEGNPLSATPDSKADPDGPTEAPKKEPEAEVKEPVAAADAAKDAAATTSEPAAGTDAVKKEEPEALGTMQTENGTASKGTKFPPYVPIRPAPLVLPRCYGALVHHFKVPMRLHVIYLGGFHYSMLAAMVPRKSC